MPTDEMFEVVDASRRVLRLARRSECHGDPRLMHPVAHVLVFNPAGQLYLQKRSMTKDIQPGRWDTSVGGHLRPGESPLAGACRELEEELGIHGIEPYLLYEYILRSPVETELVATFGLCWCGGLVPDPEEIERGAFWKPEEIHSALGTGLLTPNFEEEYRRWRVFADTGQGINALPRGG